MNITWKAHSCKSKVIRQEQAACAEGTNWRVPGGVRLWRVGVVVFTMRETGSHWRALKREVTRYDLCFKRVQDSAQSRSRNEKTDATG